MEGGVLKGRRRWHRERVASFSRITAHLRSLWGRGWPLPGGFFSGYALLMWGLGDLRVEHVGAALVVPMLAYLSSRTKQFLIDVLPALTVGIGYDMVRYVRHVFVTPERVLGCELRMVDMALFRAGENLTAQEWLAARHSPALDLLFAGPYTVFLYIVIGYGALLFFVDRWRMRWFLWAFAFANYISFALWLVVPAAPPWYVHAHGCGIDLSVPPNAAGLSRVDAYLGLTYFEAFYSRTASVFGAMPSMHNAYPVLGLLTAWGRVTWRTRPLHAVYVVWMFLASLYLDHHWIVDAFAGWATAVAAVVLARLAIGRSDAGGRVGEDSKEGLRVGGVLI